MTDEMDRMMTDAEIEGYIRVPDYLSREGQFAVHAVGDCLSTRPITPIFEGDKLIIRPIELSSLSGGEVIVIHTSFGVFTKEYIRKLGNLVYVGFYFPRPFQMGIDEDEVYGLYIVDAIMRNGTFLKAETFNHSLKSAI